MRKFFTRYYAKTAGENKGLEDGKVLISPHKLLDNSNHTIADVSTIPTGIYIVEIKSNKSELIKINKFMKK